MKDIVTVATVQAKKLEKMLEIINEFQKKQPQGFMKVHKKGEYVYYYQEYKDEKTEKTNRKYLRKEEYSLVQKLAQKQYYAVLKPRIERNLKALKHLVLNYHPEQLEEVYENLSVERKEFIVPIPGSKEERIQKWNEMHGIVCENGEVSRNNSVVSRIDGVVSRNNGVVSRNNGEIGRNDGENGRRFTTEQGELVRSKSEVIIANMLYRYRDDLMYIYEFPLELKGKGGIVIVHPDFKVMNVHTGKVTYWEHAGMMDSPSYANDSVRKINTYAKSDIVLGRDLIFTYETSDIPLDTNVVKKIIEDLL